MTGCQRCCLFCSSPPCRVLAVRTGAQYFSVTPVPGARCIVSRRSGRTSPPAQLWSPHRSFVDMVQPVWLLAKGLCHRWSHIFFTFADLLMCWMVYEERFVSGHKNTFLHNIVAVIVIVFFYRAEFNQCSNKNYSNSLLWYDSDKDIVSKTFHTSLYILIVNVLYSGWWSLPIACFDALPNHTTL